MVNEWHHQFVQRASEQLGQSGEKAAETAQAIAQDIRALMILPEDIGEHRHGLGMDSLVHSVIRANLDAAHKMLRLTDPIAVIQLQQQFMDSYLDLLVRGSAVLAQMVRDAVDRAGAL